MICRIDVYALLFANGTGGFVEVLLKQNMLPAPERCIPPTATTQLEAFSSEERSYFPALIRLNQEVLLLALQVGQLARDLRAEARQRLSGNPEQLIPETMFSMSRRTRIEALHNLMYRSEGIWRTEFPNYLTWLDECESWPGRVVASVANVW